MVDPDQEIDKLVRAALSRARQRARRDDIKFDLTTEDLNVLWEACEGRCAVSGLPFSLDTFSDALVKLPFAPSIDRINSSKGYTLKNTRLVCTAANFAMNQWGVEVLRRLSKGVVAMERKRLDRDKEFEAWEVRMRRRLRRMERAADKFAGDDLKKQRQRIAGLKRALTIGPVGLSDAAARAVRKKRRSN